MYQIIWVILCGLIVGLSRNYYLTDQSTWKLAVMALLLVALITWTSELLFKK